MYFAMLANFVKRLCLSLEILLCFYLISPTHFVIVLLINVQVNVSASLSIPLRTTELESF